ncbi:MAG: hypothetical protein AXW15_07535 [Neptuniibacter sp. Phe_28]|jgi:hypothetical protein|nr:MAG: hypothetical protein AXW15_07535 [Neptuniibacter sp. Phe_28]
MNTQAINTISSKNLIITNKDHLHPTVAALDLSKLRHKYTDTDEKEMSVLEWDKAEREYRRFLSLKCWYPGESLVPSKEVDKIWHAHILDTRAYREDCDAMFGHFMDHYPYFGIYGEEDYQMLVDAFATTKELYQEHFGSWPYPDPTEAARCAGHDCHVPSTCACRSPGTCK